jgi:hypothetical protein
MITDKHGLYYLGNLFRSHSRKPKFLPPVIRSIVVCVAVALAPQALAQCGSPINLAADQWTMIGIPCDPGANKTVEEVFGSNFGSETYNSTWVVWERTYSESGDVYTELLPGDFVETVDALWIYSTVHVPAFGIASASGTSDNNFDIAGPPALLSGGSRYYMFANPYSDTVNWSALLFRGFLGGTSPFEEPTQVAVDEGYLSKDVNYWNGNTYFTRDLSSNVNPAATFEPYESAWIEALGPTSTSVTDPVIRVPNPSP